MKKGLLLFIAIIAATCSSFAQDIYTYVAATDGSPTYTDANLSAYTNLTAIGTGTITACTDGFSGIDGFTGTTYSTTGPCIQVSLTANTGYTLSVTGFSAGLRHSSTGPTAARLAYSTDGGVTWIDDGVDHAPLSGSCATSTSGVTSAAWSPSTITSTTLQFRIYPFNASGSSGTIQVYGLHIIGTVIPTCTPPVLSASITNVSCNGGSDGAIDLTATGTTPFSYSWTGSAYTAATEDISGINAGTYTVVVTDGSGCKDTVPYTVTDPPAIVAIATNTSPACPGGSVIITGNSSTAGVTYTWTGPGGFTFAGSTFTIDPLSFTDTGAYYVTATIGGCSSAATATTVIADPATAVITPTGPTTVCQKDTVTLDANTGVGYTYQWIKDGATIPGATMSSYNAGMAGNYMVRVTNSTGCDTTSAPVTIAINPLPAVAFTTSGPLSFCNGGSVTITANTGTGYTYQWIDPAVITGATDINYVASASATYQVIVTNTLGCFDTSAGAVVMVNPIPAAVIAPAGSTTFCTGSNVELDATSGPGYTYLWKRDGIIIAGAVTSSYFATTSGSYTVIVTNSFGCSDTSAPIVVTVVDFPTLVATNPSSFCWGSYTSLQIVFDGTIVPGVTYQWQLNGTTIAGAVTTAYNAYHSGNYSCLVNVPGGCFEVTDTVSVTVFPLPNPVLYFSSNEISTHNFYATYQWYKDNTPIAGANSASLVVSSNGGYAVVVTDSNGCQSESDIYYVTTLAVETVNNSEIKIYPNPATSTIHIECPAMISTSISSMDGKALLQVANAKDIDVSALPAGMYIITLRNEAGAMLQVQKFIKQ